MAKKSKLKIAEPEDLSRTVEFQVDTKDSIDYGVA